MAYWLDLFTGSTWEEFRKAGAKIGGLKPRMGRIVAQVAPRDILLCSLTSVMCWVGALEIIGLSRNKSKIWSRGDFPVRLAVKPPL